MNRLEQTLMEFAHFKKFRLTFYLSFQRARPFPEFQNAKVSFHLRLIKSDYVYFALRYL